MKLPKGTKHLNEAQWNKYFSTWLKVREVLIKFGGESPKTADAKRKEIHRDALGVDKSSKDFTNLDLDKVLAELETYLIGVQSKDRINNGPRLRLLASIRAKGFTDEQIRGQCRHNQHAFGGRDDFEDFSEENLTVLRLQLEERRRQEARNAKAHSQESMADSNPF